VRRTLLLNKLGSEDCDFLQNLITQQVSKLATFPQNLLPALSG
jgi:hypothetical protein